MMRPDSAMFDMLTRWLLIGVAWLAVGCSAIDLDAKRSDVERTWYGGWIALPGAAYQRPTIGLISTLDVSAELGKRAPSRRWPVVLYLHGCTGLGDSVFLTRLAAAGYVVVAPDSMARRSRPLQCDPVKKRGGLNRFVYDFRMTELSFALHMLRRQPWVDTGNLFLVGASEGGVAAALYRGDAFNARVITQWTCHGAPLVNGIGASPSTPVLAIVRSDDPWYDAEHTKAQGGDCGSFIDNRPGSASIVADGQIHDVMSDRELFARILEFLESHRS